MNKIGIVIQREYSTRVRKKSFILLTFLMPILSIGLVVSTFFLSSIKDDKAKVIVVADHTNHYFPILKNTDQYQFIRGEGDFADFRKTSDKEVYATLMITDDLLKNPSAITLYSQKQVTGDLKSTISSQLNAFLSDQKLESYNIPDLKQILNDSKVSINLQTIKWDDEGNEKVSSSEVASVVGMFFTVIIYMFIFIYGGMVMQGVLEEKTNRIVEVMISSVKPFELMMGKIIGIGLVGLTQFMLWIILVGAFNLAGGLFFTSHAGAGAVDAGMLQQFHSSMSTINLVEILIYFILFFIGGYLIYASLFAAIGSMVNSQEDTQQFMMPIMILVIFALYSGIYSVQNPDGPLAFWTSMIPLFSPIVMLTRIPFDVPLWQKLLSLVLVYTTAILLIKLSSKIYRVGILMYGKKPSVGEIVKWLKY